MNEIFIQGQPLSGDAITREIYERYVRDHDTLMALYTKAREIVAVISSGGAKAAQPLIPEFRQLDPWSK